MAPLHHPRESTVSDAYREALYPLGLLAIAAFFLRFLVQWIRSERAGQSVVPALFWQLSLFGNAVMWLHGTIQVQFPVSLLQSQHLVLSWRNLALLRERSSLMRRRGVICLLVASAISTTLVFFLQATHPFSSLVTWCRSPSGIANYPFSILLLGFCGLFISSLRFWVQWLDAERKQTSLLGPSFWWLSLVGTIFASIYFLLILDWINLLGTLFAIIPYARNVRLTKKMKACPP